MKLDWLEDDRLCDGVIESVANDVKGYVFEYKDEMGLGNDEHYGVMAQDLEKNELLDKTVYEENGIKKINTDELTASNTAIIGEISRAIVDITNRLKRLEDKL